MSEDYVILGCFGGTMNGFPNSVHYLLTAGGAEKNTIVVRFLKDLTINISLITGWTPNDEAVNRTIKKLAGFWEFGTLASSNVFNNVDITFPLSAKWIPRRIIYANGLSVLKNQVYWFTIARNAVAGQNLIIGCWEINVLNK